MAHKGNNSVYSENHTKHIIVLTAWVKCVVLNVETAYTQVIITKKKGVKLSL
jgi:hypothetical protein